MFKNIRRYSKNSNFAGISTRKLQTAPLSRAMLLNSKEVKRN